MRNLLRAARWERNIVLWAHIVGLKTIVLDRVELLADSTRMFLADISDVLKICAMCLRALGLAFIQQGFEAILEQCVLVADLGVAIPFDTLKLAQ